MRAIDEIWIVKPGGITLFNLSKDDNVDPVLFGGFFSAIQTVIEQMGEEQLKTIMLGDSKITIYQGYQNYLFISRSEKRANEKIILKYLKLVETKFLEHYSNLLNEKTANMEPYKNFRDIIQEIFKDTPEKRAEEALW